MTVAAVYDRRQQLARSPAVIARRYSAKLVELSTRGRLLRSHTARNDLRHEIVFAANRSSGNAAEHRDLTDVSQGIRDGTLKDLLGWKSERSVGRQTAVQSLECGKEPLDFLIPWKRAGLVKCFFPIGQAKRPIEEVADMSKNLHWCPSRRPGPKVPELHVHVANRLPATIGQGCKGMAQHLTSCLIVIVMAAERIPIPELKKKLETSKKVVVVDVREPKEIAEGGAIPGAIHIPMGQLEKRMGELPKNAEIVFY